MVFVALDIVLYTDYCNEERHTKGKQADTTRMTALPASGPELTSRSVFDEVTRSGIACPWHSEGHDKRK